MNSFTNEVTQHPTYVANLELKTPIRELHEATPPILSLEKPWEKVIGSNDEQTSDDCGKELWIFPKVLSKNKTPPIELTSIQAH